MSIFRILDHRRDVEQWKYWSRKVWNVVCYLLKGDKWLGDLEDEKCGNCERFMWRSAHPWHGYRNLFVLPIKTILYVVETLSNLTHISMEKLWSPAQLKSWWPETVRKSEVPLKDCAFPTLPISDDGADIKATAWCPPILSLKVPFSDSSRGQYEIVWSQTCPLIISGWFIIRLNKAM